MAGVTDIARIRVTAADEIGTVLRCKGAAGGAGIVLIHGILHCSLIWKHQFADAAFDNLRLAAYDIRGHGAADKPTGAEFYRPDRFADELDAVIRASGIDRPVLVGWSLGTRMAFNYLEKYGAGAVGGLVICGARAKQVVHPGNAGQVAILQSCSDDLGERLAARIAFVQACHGLPPTAAELAEIAACAMLVPPEVLRHFAGRPMDYEALLACLPIPVAVLHGAVDPVCPLAEATRIPEINPSASLTVYPNLGHAPFFEEPATFNGDLLAFTRRCREAGAARG